MQSVKLIKFEQISPKTIKHKGREFKLEDILKEIALLFYEKGEPVESTAIAKKLGLQKTGRFTEKVIKYHLKGMVNYEHRKKERRVFVSPSALIFISEDGRVLNLTELEEFYDSLYKFSSKITVNILKEQITLKELLLPYRGREREVIKKLFELCKIAKPFPRSVEGKTVYDFAKYDLATLEGYIHRGFLLEDISQKIRDSRYKLGDLVLDFIRWYGTGRKGEEFSFDDVTCNYEERSIDLPDEIKDATEEILRKRRKEAEEKGQVFDNHPSYKLLEIKMEREIKEGERKQKIHLTFGSTDFYTSVCTNQKRK
jgi:hypothetical protein